MWEIVLEVQSAGCIDTATKLEFEMEHIFRDDNSNCKNQALRCWSVIIGLRQEGPAGFSSQLLTLTHNILSSTQVMSDSYLFSVSAISMLAGGWIGFLTMFQSHTYAEQKYEINM